MALDPYEVSEICVAASIGDLPRVKRLVQRNPALLNCADYDKRSVLHVAVGERQREVVEFLVQAGADVNARDAWNATPLADALREHDKYLISYLTDHGAEPFDNGEEMFAALCDACGDGDLPLVERLIENGAPAGRGDYDDRTPLHLAAVAGHADIVKFLLTTDAVNTLNMSDRWGRNPLAEAIRIGHDDVMEVLLGAGAVLSNAKHMETVLFKACANGLADVVRRLVRAGVDVNALNYGLRTALHLAASHGHRRIVEYLVEHGANVDAADMLGRTPLADAMHNKNDDVVAYLKSKNAQYGAWVKQEEADESGVERSLVRRPNTIEVLKELELKAAKGAAKDPTLHDILKDAELRELLLQEMRRSYNEESLLFWCDVEEFRAACERDGSQMERRARELYDQYLKASATYEINVEACMKHDAATQLDSPSATMFDELQRVVFDLIRMQDYKPFLQSVPYKQYVTARKIPTLFEVLKSPELKRLFSAFLEERYSLENLLFWEAVEGFRDLLSMYEDYSVMCSKAMQIFASFIQQGAPYEISIDSGIRHGVLQQLEHAEHDHGLTATVFDEAQVYVYQLLHVELFPKFLASSAFKEWHARKVETLRSESALSSSDDEEGSDVFADHEHDHSPSRHQRHRHHKRKGGKASDTGAIERDLWVPDDQSPYCMICATAFTVLKRRHHCRMCGKTICAKCSGQKNAAGKRVCDGCFQVLHSGELDTDAKPHGIHTAPVTQHAPTTRTLPSTKSKRLGILMGGHHHRHHKKHGKGADGDHAKGDGDRSKGESAWSPTSPSSSPPDNMPSFGGVQLDGEPQPSSEWQTTRSTAAQQATASGTGVPSLEDLARLAVQRNSTFKVVVQCGGNSMDAAEIPAALWKKLGLWVPQPHEHM